MDAHAPWGSGRASFVTDRLFTAAQLAGQRGAEAIVAPCNTATVTAIDALRERFEPRVPVIGTVPAVKSAAATGQGIAVRATVRTTSSDYQDRLIADYANGRPVERVACPGLAEAIDQDDMAAATEAIADAAERTSKKLRLRGAGMHAFPLVAPEILQSLPTGTTLYDSAEAVAHQTLRRWDRTTESHGTMGSFDMILSGRCGNLPAGAHAYLLGRALAAAGEYPRNSRLHRNSLPDGCAGDLSKPRTLCTFPARRTTTPLDADPGDNRAWHYVIAQGLGLSRDRAPHRAYLRDLKESSQNRGDTAAEPHVSSEP